MSFTAFLGQVAKVLFGYGGGFIALMAAAGMAAQGYRSTAVVLGIIALVLMLFGVYSEGNLG